MSRLQKYWQDKCPQHFKKMNKTHILKKLHGLKLSPNRNIFLCKNCLRVDRACFNHQTPELKQISTRAECRPHPSNTFKYSNAHIEKYCLTSALETDNVP